MTTSRVCIDSNIILKLVLVEDDSPVARAAWGSWEAAGTQVVAPPLFWYEVTSVLRNRTYRGRFIPEEGRAALDLIFELNISTVVPEGLHQRAWELATRLGLPGAYDAHYLALAEDLGCEFLTADARLHRAIGGRLDWVRLLEEAA